MNVLIYDQEKRVMLTNHTISIMDFVFEDQGNDLYLIVKNRFNSCKGKLTAIEVRQLLASFQESLK